MPPRARPRNLPDADVVALAQRGREPAFRELVRRYERPVFSLVFRMVRDRELAEDLAQDTFIKVLNAHRLATAPSSSSRRWIFKIANNVAIDHLRRRAARHPVARRLAARRHRREASRPPRFRSAPRQETPLEEMEAQGAGRRHRAGHRAGCAPSTAPASCCATSRAGRTRRSPRCSTCRSAP